MGPGVTELGYIGLAVGDLGAWKDFAGKIIGMEVFEAGDREEAFLRLDHHHHRIALTRGSEDDLHYLGWRVPSQGDLEALAHAFDHNGIDYRWAPRRKLRRGTSLGFSS